MADRYPLVYNPSANQLQELQSGDSLDVGNSSIKGATGYATTTGTSAQFLKADGSVDSNTYLTSSGTVALAQNLTGSPSITVSNVTGANGTFSGNITAVNGIFSGDVSIAGTITYEDVTHVDSQGIGTFRQGINVVGHSEVDTLRVSGITTFQNNVHLPDNVKINLGTGDDLQIYHNGSGSYLTQEGSGTLHIRNTTNDEDIVIQSDNGSGGLANYIVVDGSTGSVELNHYGTKKFETTGVGATVTGEMHATTFHGDGSQLTGVAAAGSGGGALDITSCLFI